MRAAPISGRRRSLPPEPAVVKSARRVFEEGDDAEFPLDSSDNMGVGCAVRGQSAGKIGRSEPSKWAHATKPPLNRQFR